METTMAYVHTIQIDDGRGGRVTEKRTSARRQYLACIVATVTETTLGVHAVERAKMATELADWRLKLEARKAALGLTVPEAEERHEAARLRWYKPGDGFLEVLDRYRGVGGQDRRHEAARQEMVSRGHEDPYDVAGPWGVCEADHKVTGLAAGLARGCPPVVGSQCVVSWHGTVALAQKSVGSLKWLVSRGEALSVRTDITITETKRRPRKAAEPRGCCGEFETGSGQHGDECEERAGVEA
jgi:hypothetical protein